MAMPSPGGRFGVAEGAAMALCDVCARPTGGEVVADADFRKAVRGGYNPFRMGLSGPTLEQIATMSQIEGTDPYESWRKRIADQTMTEWQVCNGCLPALRPFLDAQAFAAAGAHPDGRLSQVRRLQSGQPVALQPLRPHPVGPDRASPLVVGVGMVLWMAGDLQLGGPGHRRRPGHPVPVDRRLIDPGRRARPPVPADGYLPAPLRPDLEPPLRTAAGDQQAEAPPASSPPVASRR